MAIQFRDIRLDEFETMRSVFERHISKEIVESKQLPDEIAEQLASANIHENLPEGMATPEHEFKTVRIDDRNVGYVWYRVHADQNRAYIFFIYLFEAERNKGYGREIMAELEADFKRKGVVRMQVAVFGSNLAARRLYEGVGMQVTELEMSKWLV